VSNEKINQISIEIHQVNKPKRFEEILRYPSKTPRTISKPQNENMRLKKIANSKYSDIYERHKILTEISLQRKCRARLVHWRTLLSEIKEMASIARAKGRPSQRYLIHYKNFLSSSEYPSSGAGVYITVEQKKASEEKKIRNPAAEGLVICLSSTFSCQYR
jgi:hypothetical protein